jgi:hypothetical protein
VSRGNDRLHNNVLFCSCCCRPSAFTQLNSWAQLLMTVTSRSSSSYSLGVDLTENTASNSVFYCCAHIRCGRNQMSHVVYRALPSNGRFILASRCHVTILVLPFLLGLSKHHSSSGPYSTAALVGNLLLSLAHFPSISDCTSQYRGSYWVYKLPSNIFISSKVSSCYSN